MVCEKWVETNEDQTMSLICAVCGKIIVLSDNPDHHGVCARCPVTLRAQKIIDAEREN